MAEQIPPNSDGWAQEALKQVALESIKEQRRARRWSIFFRLMLLAYLTLLIFMSPSCHVGGAPAGRHTAVVHIDGMIMEDAPASAELVIESLQKAFEAEDAAGIIIKINSPGGSPVQAGLINDEIYRLRALHPDKPVYAVVTDICASGAYYVAVAAEKIYVDKASIVGSIGVRMDSFGLTGLMEKLGVERRLYTAGKFKGMLDPFLPERPEEVAQIRELLADVHQQFVDVVKKGRGDRLQADDPNLFSGLVWTGDQSVRIGLADARGDVRTVARDIVHADRLVDYTLRRDFLSSFADRLGASVARQLHLQLQSRALW